MRYRKEIEARNDNKAGLSAIVFFSCLLIFALRNNLNGIFYPTLQGHDGADLLQPFYNGAGIEYIFDLWLGQYFYIVPKFVAYLLNFLPVILIPHAYAVFSMAFTSATFVLLFVMLKGFFGKWFALYATLTIVALPLADNQNITLLSYTIWDMLIALVLLYFIPIPEARWKRAFYCIAVCVFIWSHPLSMLMLPLYAYRFYSDARHKWVHSLFCVSTVLYFLFGMIHKIVDFSKLAILPKAILNRVVVESVYGPLQSWNLDNFYDRESIYATLILIFLFSFWYLFWSDRGKKERELFFISWYLIIGTVAISIIGGNSDADFLIQFQGTRYFYIAKILFWVLLFSACFPLIQKRFDFACVHALLIGFVLINNTLGPFNSLHVYRTKIDRGYAVVEFFSHLPSRKDKCLENSRRKEYLLKGQYSRLSDMRLKGCSKGLGKAG